MNGPLPAPNCSISILITH